MKKSIKNKLKNFPSVNFISIEESQNRRDILYKEFERCGIEKVTPHIYKRYNDEDHCIIEGQLKNNDGKGPVTSHLKAIKEWYENTDEDYAFFCEDDLSFDSVKYWNFTWEQFIESSPNNWEIFQLSLTRENMFIYFDPNVKIRNRCWCDWSCLAYLITRKHAKKLIENYIFYNSYLKQCFHLEYKGTDKHLREQQEASFWFLLPQVENIIYSYFGGGHYSFPLFVENVSFEATWYDHDRQSNIKCYNEIMDWWKNEGHSKTLEDLKF